MPHLRLPLACILIVAGCAFPALTLSRAASPPQATPTSVLPLLATSLVQSGRYHSPLAPYSAKSIWPGHPVRDPGGSYDLFDGAGAEIVVLTEPNGRHIDSLEADRLLRALILRKNMIPLLLRTMSLVGQQRVALLSFSGSRGVFAAASCVAADHVWIFRLSTSFGRWEHDQQIFLRFLQSTRLEHPSAGS